MGLFLCVDQIVNLLAPALGVGFLLALGARFLGLRGNSRHGWWWHGALNALVGSLVIIAGLVYFGHDGKMATYGALVVACATTQFVSARAWRG